MSFVHMPYNLNTGVTRYMDKSPSEILIEQMQEEFKARAREDIFHFAENLCDIGEIGEVKMNITNNIKNVIHNNPATIVIWKDNSKTVVKVQNNEVYDKEKGLAMCIIKKLCDNKGNYNNVFKKWCE